jgi:3-phosphoshikimate 1-carboxyvinyltransferase
MEKQTGSLHNLRRAPAHVSRKRLELIRKMTLDDNHLWSELIEERAQLTSGLKPLLRLRHEDSTGAKTEGSLRMPGDKSISHRAAIIAALAAPGGRSHLTNYATSADCAATLACLRQLGVTIERAGNNVLVEGAGTELSHAPIAPLDCGNSGTTMRLLAGVLAGQPFASILTGDASLCSRPMKRIIEPLEMMGARISSADGRAPLRIEGRTAARPHHLRDARRQRAGQILSPARGTQRGRAHRRDGSSGVTRDHTERLFGWFGIEVNTSPGVLEKISAPIVSLTGPARLSARDCAIPGDISSAAFFIAAAAMLPGSELTINGIGLNPRRAAILEVLRTLGADARTLETYEQCHEEAGDVRVRGTNELRAIDETGKHVSVLGGSLIPMLIDELPLSPSWARRLKGGWKFATPPSCA